MRTCVGDDLVAWDVPFADRAQTSLKYLRTCLVSERRLTQLPTSIPLAGLLNYGLFFLSCADSQWNHSQTEINEETNQIVFIVQRGTQFDHCGKSQSDSENKFTFMLKGSCKN